MKSTLLKIMLICGLSLGAATYSYAGLVVPFGSEIRVLDFQASGLVDTEVTVFDDECAEALAALVDDGMSIVDNPIGIGTPIGSFIAVQPEDVTGTFPIIFYSLRGIFPPRSAFLTCGFFNVNDAAGETEPDCQGNAACGLEE
jgi:hypothetical protein